MFERNCRELAFLLLPRPKERKSRLRPEIRSLGLIQAYGGRNFLSLCRKRINRLARLYLKISQFLLRKGVKEYTCPYLPKFWFVQV